MASDVDSTMVIALYYESDAPLHFLCLFHIFKLKCETHRANCSCWQKIGWDAFQKAVMISRETTTEKSGVEKCTR